MCDHRTGRVARQHLKANHALILNVVQELLNEWAAVRLFSRLDMNQTCNLDRGMKAKLAKIARGSLWPTLGSPNKPCRLCCEDSQRAFSVTFQENHYSTCAVLLSIYVNDRYDSGPTYS
jgi:hypothetical protein